MVAGVSLPPSISRYLLGNHENAGVWFGSQRNVAPQLPHMVTVIERLYALIKKREDEQLEVIETNRQLSPTRGLDGNDVAGGNEAIISSPAVDGEAFVLVSANEATLSPSSHVMTHHENTGSPIPKNSSRQPAAQPAGSSPIDRLLDPNIGANNNGLILIQNSARYDNLLERIFVQIPDWYLPEKIWSPVRPKDRINIADLISVVLSNRLPLLDTVLEDYVIKLERNLIPLVIDNELHQFGENYLQVRIQNILNEDKPQGSRSSLVVGSINGLVNKMSATKISNVSSVLNAAVNQHNVNQNQMSGDSSDAAKESDAGGNSNSLGVSPYSRRSGTVRRKGALNTSSGYATRIAGQGVPSPPTNIVTSGGQNVGITQVGGDPNASAISAAVANAVAAGVVNAQTGPNQSESQNQQVTNQSESQNQQGTNLSASAVSSSSCRSLSVPNLSPGRKHLVFSDAVVHGEVISSVENSPNHGARKDNYISLRKNKVRAEELEYQASSIHGPGRDISGASPKQICTTHSGVTPNSCGVGSYGVAPKNSNYGMTHNSSTAVPDGSSSADDGNDATAGTASSSADAGGTEGQTNPSTGTLVEFGTTTLQIGRGNLFTLNTAAEAEGGMQKSCSTPTLGKLSTANKSGATLFPPLCRNLIRLFASYPEFAKSCFSKERIVARIHRLLDDPGYNDSSAPFFRVQLKELFVKTEQLLFSKCMEELDGTFVWREKTCLLLFTIKRFFETAREVHIIEGSDEQVLVPRLFRFIKSTSCGGVVSASYGVNNGTTNAGAMKAFGGGFALDANGSRKKYFVGGGNNKQLIVSILEEMGFTPHHARRVGSIPTFQWAQEHRELDYSLLAPARNLRRPPGSQRPCLVNHCKGIKLTEKVGMLMSLQQEYGLKNFPKWYPKTSHVLSTNLFNQNQQNGSKEMINASSSSKERSNPNNQIDDGTLKFQRSNDSNEGIIKRTISNEQNSQNNGGQNNENSVSSNNLNKVAGTSRVDCRVDSNDSTASKDPYPITNETKWVYKPRNNNCGRGILLFKTTKELTQFIETDKKTDGIVQQYIEKPLLLNGRKFDIRIYMLIARTSPFLSFFVNQGYCRLCINPYEADNFDDTSMHLTNQAVQKKAKTYQETKEDTTWTFEKLEKVLVDTNRVSPGWTHDYLLPNMKNIMLVLSRIIKQQVQPIVGTFDLFGCDFFFDEDFRIYLLEVNSNPAIYTDTAVLKQIIPQVIKETIHIVDKAHVPLPNRPFEDTGIMETLIDDARNFQFSMTPSKDLG